MEHAKIENRKVSASTSAYKGRRVVPSWLDAEPKADPQPSVTELIAKQTELLEKERSLAVAAVDEFLALGWADVEEPITQVQYLRSFAGLPSAEDRKQFKSIVESLGHNAISPALNPEGKELLNRFPDLCCPHSTIWTEPCADCDAGITFEHVQTWTVREWRDDKGHLTGQSRGANAALCKLGMSKWAEKSKLEKPVGTTATNGKLDTIDQASRRDSLIGGKRKRPQGIGPDSYDGKREDKSAGSQSDSRPDPNYEGKKAGLEKHARTAIAERVYVKTDDRNLPKHTQPKNSRERAELRKYDRNKTDDPTE